MQVLKQTGEGFDNIAQTNIESRKERIFAPKRSERVREARGVRADFDYTALRWHLSIRMSG